MCPVEWDDDKKQALWQMRFFPDGGRGRQNFYGKNGYERRNPDIIKASRKSRIAKGSGTSVQEVNKLLEQFIQMKKMMKSFSSGNFKLPF